MNLPCMITALSTAHAILSDKKAVKYEGFVVAVKGAEVARNINSSASLVFSPDDVEELFPFIAYLYRDYDCETERVFAFAHVLYHLFEESK